MSTIRKHRKKWQVLIRRKDHPEVNQGKKDRVRLTDLLSRMNEEKKKRKKKQYSSFCSSNFISRCFWNNTFFIKT
jgi:hypothetical protein